MHGWGAKTKGVNHERNKVRVRAKKVEQQRNIKIGKLHQIRKQCKKLAQRTFKRVNRTLADA